VSEAATAHNLEVLARLRPDVSRAVSPRSWFDGRPLRGLLTMNAHLAIADDDRGARASVRATTQDRLPFAGAPPELTPVKEKAPDGTPAPSGRHRLIGGLGSRGFLWAPLLAEIVASEAFGDPSPVEASVAECLDPGRFRTRAIRRGKL
jgi:tRNA 5-methylaminomethyl-2-thiouridine biosynthesis bifunctional protein